MALRKATRQVVKLRLALSGATGSGKTYSALLMAFGMTGDWSKIAVIDTENNSADLYANLGDYNVSPLEPPYTTDKYIKAIKECEDEGMELIIIDSITHEWSGQGGILQAVDQVTASSNSNNKFSTGWKTMTPKHDEFISAMLHSKCDIIATMRSKQEYVLIDDAGKKIPKKLGLAPIQREGVEYEFTLQLDMASNNNATALKDRTGLFTDAMPFKPTVETGQMIKDWCKEGLDIQSEVDKAVAKLKKCNTVDDLKMLKEVLPQLVISHKEFIASATDQYNTIMAAKDKKAQKNEVNTKATI